MFWSGCFFPKQRFNANAPLGIQGKKKLRGKCVLLCQYYKYLMLQMCMYGVTNNMPNNNCLFSILPNIYFPGGRSYEGEKESKKERGKEGEKKEEGRKRGPRFLFINR